MFRHRNAPESTDGHPSPSANVPEGLTGPAVHPLSPLLMALASHFIFPSPLMVATSQALFLPHKDLYLPTYLHALLPFLAPYMGQREQHGQRAHIVSQELAGRRCAFSRGFQIYDIPKMGDLCTLSQRPFAKAIFVFSSLLNSSICASLPFFPLKNAIPYAP